jgi:hypothetical protein
VLVTRRVQVSGSARLAAFAALPIATLAAMGGCAIGRGSSASTNETDAGSRTDATSDGGTEVDAPVLPGCAIAPGITPALDGSGDVAQYPAEQQLTPGAMLGTDVAAIAWNPTHLFLTVTSNAFTAPYEPLHVYVETGSHLGVAAASQGKEYSNLTPALPFTPSHLVAVRRVSDSGAGGAYNGVFVPTDGWMNRTVALEASTFVSTDQRTLSVSVPWSALGDECPTTMRLALHVVHGQAANEWKDLIPSTHTPWQAPGGGYYEIDLTGALAASAWTLR